MKLLAVLLTAGVSLLAADLSAVKTVYVLRMSNSLDQYLALRLAHDGALRVVTDPQKADAIFTDRIGENFEQEMKNLYAPPAKANGKLGEDEPPRAVMQPLSHGSGSVFLVDRASREVLWTTYIKPKGRSADEMNHLAGKIVEELDKSRKTQVGPTK